MSLVPIIYTSLLIFAAFLFLIIIISYISYKTKSRYREEKLFVSVPRFVNQAPQLATLHLKDSSINYLAKVSQMKGPLNNGATIKRKNSENPIKNYPEQRYQHKAEQIREKYISEQNARQTRYATNYLPMANRIQIVNDSQRFRSTPERKNPVNTFHISYISEKNLINFYSDTPDNEFKILNVV